MDGEIPNAGTYTALLSEVLNATPTQYSSLIREMVEQEDLNWAYEGVDIDTNNGVSLEEDEDETLFFKEVDGVIDNEAEDIDEPFASPDEGPPKKSRTHESLSQKFLSIDNDTDESDLEENIGVLNEDATTKDLAVGLRFNSKESLVQACKRYSIKCNQQHKVEKSNDNIYIIWCVMREVQGCKWRLRAIKSKKHKMWEIRKYEGPHTCLYAHNNQDHRQLDSNFIAKQISNCVKTSPSMCISLVVAKVLDEFKYTISYRKAWKAKQKAIETIFGDWDISYRLLPPFLHAVCHYNSGSIVNYQYTNTAKQGEAVLNRVFWAFGPSIVGFTHCRPVVSIDGTHLYGKYKGKLLIATGCDSENKLYPLAFAIVEEESTDSWLWFLQQLRHFVVPNRQNLCLISDRHKGIIAAVNMTGSGWEAPYAYHRFCHRHVEANFIKKFKDPLVCALFKRAAKERQVRKYLKVMEEIKNLDKKAYDYLNDIAVEKWTLAYDGGARYGIETTNLSEVLNNVVKGARNLPITALVQMTFYKLVAYFCKRREMAQKLVNDGVQFPDKIKKLLSHNQSRACGHRMVKFNAATGVAEVTTRCGNNVQVVRITDRVCSCNKWVLYKIPCSHVIALCQDRNFGWLQFVDGVYSTNSMLLAYTPQFQPLEHQDYWPTPDVPTFLPDDNLLRGKGRPRSTRIKNIMDKSKQTLTYKCKLCHEHGHNCRKCPNLN